MKRLLAALTVTGGMLAGAAMPCVSLSPGQTARTRISKGHPVCFWVTVEAGEPAQLTAEQPVDLAIRITDATTHSVTDGFDFGPETITILAAGRYRIDVLPVDASAGSVWIFSMSWQAGPLQQPELWRRAEISATKSKQTRKLEDAAESFGLWKMVGDASAIAREYLKSGYGLSSANDRLGARANYEEALRICDSNDDLRCVAEAANNSGYASFLLGDFEAALRRLQEAAGYWRRLALLRYEGRTLNNLGLLFWQSGDLEQAIKVLDQARRILCVRDPMVHAQVLNNLGLCYQSLSENEKAIAYFQSALTGLLAQHQRAARARLNLGRSYMLLGKLGRAESILRRALVEATKASNSAVRADVLNNLGQVLLKLHRGDEARACLTEALALQRAVHSRRGEGIALHYLGVDASERHDTDAARESFVKAAQIRRENGLRDDASESMLALADLEYRAGNLTPARDLAGQAIDLIESLRDKVPGAALRASYFARKRRFFDILTEMIMATGGSERAAKGFLASEEAHGRSILDLVTGGTTSIVPRDLIGRRTSLRSQIAVLSQHLTEADPPRLSEGALRKLNRDRENVRLRVELLLGEEDQVDSEIRKAVQASVLGRPLASVAELQAGLPVDSAVLEYYLGERESYLWLVQAGNIQWFPLPARAVIEALASRTVTRFGAILDRRRSPPAQAAFEADLSRLSAALLGPLAGIHLPRRLVFVLDGLLNRVPMAALRPPWAREALGLSFDLIHSPSAAFLLAAKPPGPIAAFPRSVLVIADPVFSARPGNLWVV